MSNAMRTGKRWLAGVAAGALGAGLITFAAAPAAQASTAAATVSFQYPSVTAVVSGVTSNAEIPVQVVLRDAVGAAITSGNLPNQRVQITVTQPATADDTSVIIANVNNSGGTVSGNDSQNLQDDSVVNLAGLGFKVRTSYFSGQWGQLLQDLTSSPTNPVSDAGTYTMTARLFNTSTGAVISTATMPLNIVSNTATTAAGVTFISGPAISQTGTAARANILDRLGVTGNNPVQATAATGEESFALWVTDSAGGPYITLDDSVTAAGSALAGSGTDVETQGGWNTLGSLTSNADLRVYQATTGGNPAYTSTAGNASLTATVTATGSSPNRGSATLPVSVSSVQNTTAQGGAPVVLLDNEGAYYVGDDTYQVPPGTTKLTFTTITSTGSVSDTTIPFNGWSTVNLSAISPSGGVSLQKADTGAIEVTLPAASTVAGSTYNLYSGVQGQETLVQVVFAAPAPLLDANTPLVKLGEAATVTGSITDQYGNPLPGTWAIAAKASSGVACTATSIGTAVAAADGSFTLTIPASFSPTLAGVATFGLCASNGITVVPATGTAQAEYVQYTTTGGVSSLTLTSEQSLASVTATTRPLIKTPANGTALLSVPAGGIQVKNPAVPDDSAVINATASAIQLEATVAPQVAVTFTGTDGLLFTDRSGGAIFHSQASSSLTVDMSDTPPLSTSVATPVWVIATKPGLHTVTATAGTSTATYTLYAAVPNNAARTFTVTPDSFNIAPNSFRTMKFAVKDIFGNPVPFYGGFSVVQAGGGTLSPAAGSVVTNALGEAEQFYTAPAGTGDVRLDYTGGGSGGGALGGAWVTGAIPGAPDAVRTASVNIRVGGSADKSIVIVGERTTVSGKPGIMVDGDANGFDAGAQFKPWVRFPGQTSYTLGTARPTSNATGEFVWKRKTGKKTYVYFTSADDVVKSNRIIIPAN